MREGSVLPGGQVRVALWSALRDQGLWPDLEEYEAARARVITWGEEAIGELQRVVGDGAWRRALAEVAIRDVDVVRMLGIGQLLTEHFVAPLRLPSASRSRAARLGAMANLIVAIYDHCLDAYPQRRDPLPRSALCARSGGRGRLIDWRRLLGRPDQRLLGRLVRHYYAGLGRLAGVSASGARIDSLIRRAILRMYDAEELTRKRAPAPGAATLRRKAAMPFVVMGLSGWLLDVPGHTRLSWHLRWLYRLGLYFGWIDDAVDLEADLGVGHPNRIATELAEAADRDRALQAWARQVAAAAVGLRTAWCARVGEDERGDPVVSRALELTTCSWFGGTGWQPWTEDGLRARA